MSINRAELGKDNALVNAIHGANRDQNEQKTTPQHVGNGSLAYAVFSYVAFGPVSVAAGARASFNVLFMDISQVFTYNGQPAINRNTLQNIYLTPYVDTHDAAHVADYGAGLSAGQVKVDFLHRSDYYGSGLTETNGQFLVVIKAINNDTAAHNVYIDVTALIPRPALKPQ